MQERVFMEYQCSWGYNLYMGITRYELWTLSSIMVWFNEINTAAKHKISNSSLWYGLACKIACSSSVFSPRQKEFCNQSLNAPLWPKLGISLSAVSCKDIHWHLSFKNISSATIDFFLNVPRYITVTPRIGISLVNRWPPYHTISNHTIPSKQMTTLPYHNIPYQTNRWPPIKCHLVGRPLKGAGRIANQISAVTKGTSDLVNPMIQKTYQGNLLSATPTI